MTADISGAGPIFEIVADDVMINLNGHRLSATTGSVVEVTHVARVQVENGILRGGGQADWSIVNAVAVDGIILDRIIVEEGSVDVRDSKFELTDMIVDPIFFAPFGIHASGQGSIERNVVHGYVKSAFRIEGSAITIMGNTTGADVDGAVVRCTDCTIAGNRLAGDFALGLVGDQNAVVRNRLMSYGWGGVGVSGRWNQVASNYVTNSLFGISVGGEGNRIVANRLDYTRLVLSGTRNVYGDNIASWFDAAPPDWVLTCPGGVATKNFCDLGRGNRSIGGNLLPDPM